MESQAERVAKNESLFREVNERILEAATSLDAPTMSAVCECSRNDCAATVSITLPEYARVRADGKRFALLHGHEDAEFERIVEANDRFVVVEKIGEGADVARALDPRKR